MGGLFTVPLYILKYMYVPKLILVNISEIPILKIQSDGKFPYDGKISWTVIKSTVGHVNFHT